MAKNIEQILEMQKKFFRSGITRDIEFRMEMLEKLYTAVKDYEDRIADALKADLGKSDHESFMCETGMVLSEITYMKKHLKKFAANQKVKTSIMQFPAKCYKKPMPRGNVLIMSPWNYPFLLTMAPLANAIAAGNTVVLKPSAYAAATSALLEEMISDIFSEDYVSVITGGREENQALLNQKFDLIFFTGSQKVGKEVLRRAAEHLTPAILELGGKSPCIVDSSAKIKMAARRIVFGKFLNCGQTCVAPDYILCDKEIKYELISEIRKQVKLQYGLIPTENPKYGKMISEKHFDRVLSLIDAEKVVLGGNANREKLKIAPTVMYDVNWDDPVMQEEIFGPVLPILTYDKFEDIFTMLENKPHPLALYLFSQDKKHIREVLDKISCGGSCINDTIMHLATSEMGFGGIGESGMGSYHGKEGFDAFSHSKKVLEKKGFPDLPMRYQPYKILHKPLLNQFLK